MLTCPKCGNDSDNIDFIDAFCIKCAAERIVIACPKKIEIAECKHCSRMRIRGEWTKNRQELDSYIVSKCKGEFSRAVYDNENDDVIFFIIKNGKQLRITKKLNLEIKIVTCENCSRLSGGYYESIIQLRGDEEMVKKYLRKLEKALGISLLKIEIVKGGVDLYGMSNEKTMQMLANFELKNVMTRKLFGRRDGKPVFRTTYSVRF